MGTGGDIHHTNGADREVVALFALFHDSRRLNQFRDDGHGLRAGEFARSLRGTLIHLDDVRFDLLFQASRLHTDGLTEGDPTLQACWDADRLDLARVGIMPKPDRLCPDTARELPWWRTRVRLATTNQPWCWRHGVSDEVRLALHLLGGASWVSGSSQQTDAPRVDSILLASLLKEGLS
jgi:uncharacterized protein